MGYRLTLTDRDGQTRYLHATAIAFVPGGLLARFEIAPGRTVNELLPHRRVLAIERAEEHSRR